MLVEASKTVTFHGIDGVFFLIAAILFGISAVIAWFVQPKAYWPTFVAVGLMLWVITNLVH